MAMRTMNVLGRRLKARKATSGDTQVFVVEDSGELVAVVVDKQRGVVRIPLGATGPRTSFASCSRE